MTLMSARIHRLAAEFVELTDEMNDLLDRKRELSLRRDQVALELSQTGLYLYQIGKLVGLKAPTLCRIIQKAKYSNARTREGHPAGDREPAAG